MTPQNLKEEYESFKAANKEPAYYFSPDTMKFFGDTMANYKVTEETIDGTDYYVLHRKRPIKKSFQPAGPCAYFRKSDMRVLSTPRGDL